MIYCQLQMQRKHDADINLAQAVMLFGWINTGNGSPGAQGPSS